MALKRFPVYVAVGGTGRTCGHQHRSLEQACNCAAALSSKTHPPSTNPGPYQVWALTSPEAGERLPVIR